MGLLGIKIEDIRINGFPIIEFIQINWAFPLNKIGNNLIPIKHLKMDLNNLKKKPFKFLNFGKINPMDFHGNSCTKFCDQNDVLLS